MSSSADSVSSHEGSHLWTLEEIGRLTSHSGNHADTLSNIVLLIQQRFGTDVCSVYLLEPDRANLVLAATIGLRPESVGRVRMHLSEGLAGLVAEQLRPQVLADATRHPRFKYFPEAGEDPYRSFLGVPVIDRGLLQGVLVVQTVEPRVFNADDVRMFVTAGAQLAPLVSEARTVGQFVAPAHQRLRTLAQNLWWSWDHEATSLFRELDPVLWRELDSNPIALLDRIPSEGADLWLNNPRRPLEACGTSGQKVVLNGGLNLSVLDGWWAEAYDGFNGFAIGAGHTHRSTDVHDRLDGNALMRALKDEVIPLYYDRDRDGLPREWIARMKRAIRTLGFRFSADRMVKDYVRQCYVPAARAATSRNSGQLP